MRARHARHIRRGIALFRLNLPRFSFRGASLREPFLTHITWMKLERDAEVKHG